MSLKKRTRLKIAALLFAACAAAIIIIALAGLSHRLGLPLIERIRICRAQPNNSLCIYLAQSDERLAIIKQTEESALERETQFKNAYLAQNIPLPIAELGASIERQEEDIKILTAALAEAASEDQISLQTAINDYDRSIMTSIRNARSLLEKYHEKAVRTKNINLFKLVTILQSCSFLFERSA